LKSWPKAIQWDFGTSLREMQNGRTAKLQVRPMQSIGAGVFELKDADETGLSSPDRRHYLCAGLL
jgi:phage-related protein